VGPLLVAGVGSGGSATLVTLAAVPGLAGPFALVDPDEIIRRNLQRYTFAVARHAIDGAKKVQIGAQLLGISEDDKSALVVDGEYGQYSETLRERGFLDLVVGTVHTGTARRQIQKDLARALIDAAVTENGEAVIRRVFFGESACMGCFYPFESIYKESKVLAQLIGLSVEEVEELARSNGKFTQAQVERISKKVGKPPEVGARWGDWRQRCSKLPAFVEAASTEVPAAHVTAAAGVLLAGEVVKDRFFPDAVLRSYFVLDTLGRFSPAYPYVRQPSRTCDICGDADAREVYRRRYGNPSKR
jgi:hypothetical protein